MNHPKFKHGDKVSRKYPDGSTNDFIVSSIYFFDGKFLYAEGREFHEWYEEPTLEVCKEPQKKKLFAYRNGSEVKFTIGDMPYAETVEDRGDGLLKITKYARTPEFDIEFE